MPEILTADPASRAQRIARIAVLLGELEALSRDAREVPLPLLAQAQVNIEKARSLLEDCGHYAANDAELEERDPQPEVDGEILDRMYRALRAGRRPSDR